MFKLIFKNWPLNSINSSFLLTLGSYPYKAKSRFSISLIHDFFQISIFQILEQSEFSSPPLDHLRSLSSPNIIIINKLFLKTYMNICVISMVHPLSSIFASRCLWIEFNLETRKADYILRQIKHCNVIVWYKVKSDAISGRWKPHSKWCQKHGKTQWFKEHGCQTVESARPWITWIEMTNWMTDML